MFCWLNSNRRISGQIQQKKKQKQTASSCFQKTAFSATKCRMQICSCPWFFLGTRSGATSWSEQTFKQTKLYIFTENTHNLKHQEKCQWSDHTPCAPFAKRSNKKVDIRRAKLDWASICGPTVLVPPRLAHDCRHTRRGRGRTFAPSGNIPNLLFEIVNLVLVLICSETKCVKNRHGADRRPSRAEASF